MQMVGAFAEFERAMLKERTKAGLDAARKEGRIGGRPPKLKPHQQQEIVTLVKQGKTAADAARSASTRQRCRGYSGGPRSSLLPYFRFHCSPSPKVAIAQTHLVPAQNRAAGLSAAPVRFTRGACRRIIRDYTSERGIRQLTRCLRTVCRKVTLGLETGDASLVRQTITAREVRAYLGEPDAGRTDGVEHLRARLEDAALPNAVLVRGRRSSTG